jgi:hypothetical protein
MNVDIARLRASVWFTGDDGPIEVGIFPGSIPKDLGDYRTVTLVETSTIGPGGLVYVENFRGQPYITRILSGGEYTLNQQVAGLSNLAFNATAEGPQTGPPVSDIYERRINVKLAAPSLPVGSGMLVGPWAGASGGSQIDGIIDLVVTWNKNCRKYSFSISDAMVVDLEGDEGNKAFWMRLLPQTNLSRNPDAELAIDVALVKTGIRAPIEFWFRIVPIQSTAASTTYLMSVTTYGSAFNVGDPSTGRMVAIKQDTIEPMQGWVGFNNAGLGWTERDEYSAFPWGTYYQNGEWSSGSWRSSPLRAANDISWTWRTSGQLAWDGTNFSWEGNLVFTGIGAHYNALPAGTLNVPMPSNVAVFPANTADFSTQIRGTSGGIPLKPGETLYYGLVPGIGTGGATTWMSANTQFFIVDSKTYPASTHAFGLPEWAVPIAARTFTAQGERSDIFICSPEAARWLDDKTTYTAVAYTSPHNGLVGGDETETMYFDSFRFKKKTAYRFEIKGGISSSTTQAVLWRLRKGTTAAGALIFTAQRTPIIGGASVNLLNFYTYIVNDTTADIVTTSVLCGLATGANTTTWNRYAGTGNDATTMTITEVGPSSKYAYQWPLIT